MTDISQEEELVLTNAATAATNILKGVASSDFVSDYGHKAAYGLRDYHADIAKDVAQAFLNRLLSEDEAEWLVIKCNNERYT